VDKFITNFINRGSNSLITTLDDKDGTFHVLVTHQNMKKTWTSVTVLEEITLEVEMIQLQFINPVQERDVISGIIKEVLMILQINLSFSNSL
jgi:hypothetical protein